LADLKAVFDLIHIDPTKNPFLKGDRKDIETIIGDTVDLIAYLENEREKLGLPEIVYEVGTEDIRGGLTKPAQFRSFLMLLKKFLKSKKSYPAKFCRGSNRCSG